VKSVGFTASECRTGLQSYLAEVEELMELVENPEAMGPEDIEKARQQLKNLKSCLKRDYDLRSTEKGREAMTAVESAIFHPTVHQAYADLAISAASKPTKQWLSELYDTKVTIDYALENLAKWQE